MSTDEKFSPATFRAQANKLLAIGTDREAPTLPFELGKAAAYLMNAADYIERANDVLSRAEKTTDDNDISRRIKKLLE